METHTVHATARQWTFRVIAAFWLVVVALNSPGHLSYDSIVQLNEARSRSYAGLHPPLMSYLMMLFDAVVPGTALFVLFMQALFFGAVMIVVLSARHVGFWTPVIVALGCLHPLVVVYQGIVWKDVLFANLGVFAFALLFAAQRLDGWRRHAIYALAVLTAACSGLMRQNGVFVLMVLAMGIIHLETRSSSLLAWTGKIVAGGAGAASVLALVTVGTNALIRASANSMPENAYEAGLGMLMRYDIAGILARNNAADMALFRERGIDTDALRRDAVTYYMGDRLDWLNQAQSFRDDFGKVTFSELVAGWAAMVAANPIAYLRHRLSVFRWMMWPPDIIKCLPLHTGILGPADLISQLDLPEGYRSSDKILQRYSYGYFVHTPLFRNLLFFLVAIAMLAILPLRHGWRAAMPAMALLVAAVLFSLSWIAIGIACDMRYMYFLPLSMFVSIVMLSLLEAERAALVRENAHAA
jgi:hypothetical protein